MELTQYQIERKEIIANGGDLNQFAKDWHNKACDSYRKNVKTKEDINNFRRGNFTI